MDRNLLELTRSVERDCQRVDRLMTQVAKALLENAAEPLLSDQERALMWGVLSDLIATVAAAIAGRLPASLTQSNHRPVVYTATRSDSADASALLQLLRDTGTLHDPALIRLVYARTKAHLLSETLRTGAGGATVAESDRMAESLLDADTLVRLRHREIESIDRYGDPRLPIEDLPAELRERLYWDVAAALRLLLLDSDAAETAFIDDRIEAATAEILQQPLPLPEADRLRDAASIPPSSLVEALERGEIFLFLMLFGRMTGLPLGRIRELAFGGGEAEFAAVCRAIEIPRCAFAELYLLVHQHSRKTVRDASALAGALNMYDTIDRRQAADLLRLWRRHPRYLGALRRVTGG